MECKSEVVILRLTCYGKFSKSVGDVFMRVFGEEWFVKESEIYLPLKDI